MHKACYYFWEQRQDLSEARKTKMLVDNTAGFYGLSRLDRRLSLTGKRWRWKSTESSRAGVVSVGRRSQGRRGQVSRDSSEQTLNRWR